MKQSKGSILLNKCNSACTTEEFLFSMISAKANPSRRVRSVFQQFAISSYHFVLKGMKPDPLTSNKEFKQHSVTPPASCTPHTRFFDER
mmetsp:Transcript_21426/g.28166  ORF Transcript_21426/g.28166 Transcript_21426/m.28166 type:complete len:89 (+) Transcript_21426:1-267(+)